MLFGWRKRSEGFEWREYVRTTILVRRADRQKRLDDARLAALAKVHDAKDRARDAGVAKVNAVREGAAAAGRKASDAVAGAVVNGAGRAFEGGRRAAGFVGQAAAVLPRPAAPVAVKRIATDAAMYVADMPRRWRLLKPYLLPAAGLGAAVFVFGAALSPAVMRGAGEGTSTSSASQAAMTATGAPLTTGSLRDDDGVLTGRASVVSGHVLKVGNRLVALDGIEAPERAQPCFKSKGRKWECGAAARSALRRLVRGKTISCELKDPSAEGIALAHCREGALDLAETMVRKGHAFARDGSAYAAAEEAARQERAGIWQGEVQRPQDWRDKVWGEAKQAAPLGCPIKGFVKGDGRVYAMPWSDGYGARDVRTTRGEKWFCSEDEARAAGFKQLPSL